MPRPSFGLLATAVMIGTTTLGCTEANLCVYPCQAPEVVEVDNVVELEGTACTVEPNAVIFPYKILFVIDVSGSNRDSDPSDNRAKAVQRVFDSYIENRAVSFGVVSFNNESELLTPSFTRDYATLVPDVVNSLKRKDGGTNYTDTLELVHQFIEEDARHTPEAERARTRYDIQWLSDGIPDPCVRPGPIVSMTEELLGLREKYGFFDMRLSTIRLYHPGYAVAGCTDLTPTDYLMPMAEVGRGTFQELTSEQINFQVNFTEIFRRFEHRQFYLVNESRVVMGDEAWADSDADGIRDIDEDERYDALEPDSNHDGCLDRVDEELLPNVGLCSSYCADAMQGGDPLTLLDGDFDGIPDCAEQTLGYHRLSSDTDRDGFSDLLELKLATNPLDARTLTQDADRDGVIDADEIRQGTNPNYPEGSDMFKFEYGPTLPVAATVEGTSCFSFSVENVRLVHTRATSRTAEGDNLLCLYLVQTSVDDPEQVPTVTKACKIANYRETQDGAVKTPADGRIEITPADFAVMYCDSATCGPGT